VSDRQAVADLVHLRRNSGPEITITAVAHGTLVLGITASEAGHDGAAHGLKYRNGWDGQQTHQDWRQGCEQWPGLNIPYRRRSHRFGI
jgi:hypothetical protein